MKINKWITMFWVGVITGVLATTIVANFIATTPVEILWQGQGFWLNGHRLYDFDWYGTNLTIYAVGEDYSIYQNYCRCEK